jgi:hypothetical protein
VPVLSYVILSVSHTNDTALRALTVSVAGRGNIHSRRAIGRICGWAQCGACVVCVRGPRYGVATEGGRTKEGEEDHFHLDRAEMLQMCENFTWNECPTPQSPW